MLSGRFNTESLITIDHEIGVHYSGVGMARKFKYCRLAHWECLRATMDHHYTVCINHALQPDCGITFQRDYARHYKPLSLSRISEVLMATIDGESLLLAHLTEVTNRPLLVKYAQNERRFRKRNLSIFTPSDADLMDKAIDCLVPRLIIMATSQQAAATIAAMVRMSI